MAWSDELYAKDPNPPRETGFDWLQTTNQVEQDRAERRMKRAERKIDRAERKYRRRMRGQDA